MIDETDRKEAFAAGAFAAQGALTGSGSVVIMTATASNL
jgi:ATP-dependent phosphofructokinase / diphosphate-dependent phosphofructokinase